MSTTRAVITLDRAVLRQVDRLVALMGAAYGCQNGNFGVYRAEVPFVRSAGLFPHTALELGLALRPEAGPGGGTG